MSSGKQPKAVDQSLSMFKTFNQHFYSSECLEYLQFADKIWFGFRNATTLVPCWIYRMQEMRVVEQQKGKIC